MSIPSLPQTPPPGGVPPNSFQGAPPPNEGAQTSLTDPTGSWQKFLSMSGTPATKEDVERFFQTLLKTFATLIQQQAAAHQRAMEACKKAFTGDE